MRLLQRGLCLTAALLSGVKAAASQSAARPGGGRGPTDASPAISPVIVTNTTITAINTRKPLENSTSIKNAENISTKATAITTEITKTFTTSTTTKCSTTTTTTYILTITTFTHETTFSTTTTTTSTSTTTTFQPTTTSSTTATTTSTTMMTSSSRTTIGTSATSASVRKCCPDGAVLSTQYECRQRSGSALAFRQALSVLQSHSVPDWSGPAWRGCPAVSEFLPLALLEDGSLEVEVGSNRSHQMWDYHCLDLLEEGAGEPSLMKWFYV